MIKRNYSWFVVEVVEFEVEVVFKVIVCYIVVWIIAYRLYFVICCCLGYYVFIGALVYAIADVLVNVVVSVEGMIDSCQSHVP